MAAILSRLGWVNCMILSCICSCVRYDELQPSRWSAEISLSSLAVHTPVTRADTTSQIHHRTTQGIQRGHHMDDWEITRGFGHILLALRNYCFQLIWYRWFSVVESLQSGTKPSVCPCLYTIQMKFQVVSFNSLRPSDAYMCQQTNHHWFR